MSRIAMLSSNDAHRRTLLLLAHPQEWPQWPFLPLVRRRNGEEELGVIYDAMGFGGKTGYSATVFLCNLFDIPLDEDSFLALPHETFDTCLEVYEAGWHVD